MDRLLEKDMHQMYKHHKGNAAFYGQQFKHGSNTQTAPHNVPAAKTNKTFGAGVPSTLASFSPSTYFLTNLVTQNGSGLLQRSVSGLTHHQHILEEEESLTESRRGTDDDSVSHLQNLLDETSLLSDNRIGSPEHVCHSGEDGDGDIQFVSRGPSPPFLAPSDAASDSSSSGISRGTGAQRFSNNSDGGDVSRPPFHASTTTHTSPASGTVSCTNATTSSRSADILQRPACLKSRHRRYVTPCIPNQASEAEAHFMTELAKRLLTEAGGNHSTAIFNAPQNGPQQNQENGNGPHRALHVCAFQIGLYALGLHNKVTPNWLSRTYSSHVSWISGQAMEIGRSGIRILIDTWENHLTPTEVANLADKGSSLNYVSLLVKLINM